MRLRGFALALCTVALFAASLSAQPLSGTYSVGPGGAYPNLAAAIAALGSNGVAAPVVFFVTANDTGPWTLGPFPGQGPANPVLFDGGGTTVLGGTQPMLTLGGCANVTFRGFVGTFNGATNAFVVNAGTTDCVFTNCDFQAPPGDDRRGALQLRRRHRLPDRGFDLRRRL